MWSDTNLTPFMVVTAHWIEMATVQMPQGPQHILKLWSDLIGFQHCPGRHTREHLAQAFLHVLEWIQITSKVWELFVVYCIYAHSNLQIGWVTLDNTSNNDTFMVTLAAELWACRIPFDAVKHRIRWVYHLLKYGLVFINHKSCFPHIVNLVCKAVLASITLQNIEMYFLIPILLQTFVLLSPQYVCAQFGRYGTFLIHFSDSVIVTTVPVLQWDCQDHAPEGAPASSWCWYMLVINPADDWTCTWTWSGLSLTFSNNLFQLIFLGHHKIFKYCRIWRPL